MEKIGLEALFRDADFRKGIANYTKSVQEAERATDKAAGDITKSTEKIGNTWEKDLSKVGGYAAGMGAVLSALATKVTLTAARNQELAIVVETVGRNIGKSAQEMNKYVEGVKSMGITTAAARQSVIQMAQAQIDLEQSTELARLAQDAAVIGQLNSSEAFEQLITGVQRGSLVMLRQIGITASFERAYADAAKQLGKTTAQLTEQEKIQARVNEVLKNANQIAGTYEAAMGSAGKQMRSMTRYVEELEAEFGEALLPAFGAAVGAGTDFLKFLLDLPAPVKETAAQMAALSAGILTVAGSAAFALPKIVGLVNAMAKLAGVGVLGLGPIGLGVGAIAAAATAVVYLNNLEKAHQAEAVAVLESSTSYENYVLALKGAERESYAMSESLYEIAKAAQAATDGLDLATYQKARDDLTETTQTLFGFYSEIIRSAKGSAELDEAIGLFSDQLPTMVDDLTNLQLQILTASDEMYVWAINAGLDAEAARELADALAEAARAEQVLRYNEQASTTSIGDHEERMLGLVETTEEAAQVTWDYRNRADSASAVEEIFADKILDRNDAMTEATKLTKEQEEALGDLEKALEDALDAYKDIFDAMASGVTDIRDVNEAISDSTTDHKAKIRDLRGDLTDDINAINEKYSDMLPDKTSVADRLKMSGDAWDEWALRAGALMDGVQGDTEAGWAATIAAATQATGSFQREGETFQGYLERFVGDFYKNEYPGLINSATGVYSQHVAEKERLRAEDTADAQARAQEQIAAENAAYQEQQKRLKEQRAEKTVLAALELAEATGALQDFATSAFPGAMGQIVSDAATFFDYWSNGIITLDAEGNQWLQDQVTGILTLTGTTQQEYENAKQATLDFYNTGAQGAAENASELENLKTKLGELTAERALIQGEMKVLDPADLEDANKELGRLDEQIADVKKQIEGLSDPFAIAVGGEGAEPEAISALGEAVLGVAEAFPELGTAASDAKDAMVTALTEAATSILTLFINGSVIPDLVAGMAELGPAMEGAADTIADAGNRAAEAIIASFKRMQQASGETVQAIKNDIASIPRSVTIKVDYVDPPPAGPNISAIEGAELVADAIADIPSTVAVDVAFTPTIGEVRAIGENLGRALVDALHSQVRNSRRWVGQLLDVGQQLEGIGSFLADLFKEDFIEPLDYMIEGFDEQLEFIRDRVQEIGEALGDLPEDTSIEDQYKDAQDDLDELNKMLEDQSFLRRLDEDQYAELLRKRGELEQQQAERRAQLEQERTDLLEQQKRLEEERNQLALERQQREEELLRLQEAQADLALLEQQFRLLDLIREWKLEPGDILGGLELGLDASIPDLLAAISAAMQAIAEQANEDLGIASPSKVFEEKGRMIREGLMKGLMEPVGNASQYSMPIPMTAPLQAGNTVNVAFGQTTINNGMDYEVFQAGVLRTVRDAIRYGG